MKRWLVMLRPRSVQAFLVLIILLSLVPLSSRAASPARREINLEASRFDWQPEVIHVNRGDQLVFNITSTDVVHGFYLDGYEVNETILPGETRTVTITADKAGKFRFRCSYTCGNIHPFMIGELVVEPNTPYTGAVVLTLLTAAGTVGYVWTRKGKMENGRWKTENGEWKVEDGTDNLHFQSSVFPLPSSPFRLPLSIFRPTRLLPFDLLQIGALKRLLDHRAFQYFVILPNLLFFVLILMAGFFGTPVGNHNFAIIFVWIVWWAVLITLLIPFGARVWCTMCPIPAPGEWLQRLGFVLRRKRQLFTLGKVWPRRLRNIWLQNFSFLTVAILSAIILTTPIATGIVLSLFIVLAIVLSLVYQRRAFCRYVCPVGGFIGLYSLVAPLELRVKDPEVCRRHCGKECIRGSADAFGCPWLEYPGTMNRNAYCGLCTECIKACPVGNVGLNLRAFGKDLLVPYRHLDEAYKAFIMLTSAGVYSAVMLGPWGWLKDWANLNSLPTFTAYAVGLLALNLVVVPGIFLTFSWLSRRLAGASQVPLRRVFVTYAYSLVPMGLMAWIAFSIAFVFINISYAIPLLSDPFGWGWDLLGTKHYPWTPYLSGWVPYFQIPVLLVGLVLSILLAHRLSEESFPDPQRARRALVPVAMFLMGVTLVFLRLYLG
ncbi:MAG: cupredoxin domain-containing protein [Anaerolineae bacterium]